MVLDSEPFSLLFKNKSWYSFPNQSYFKFFVVIYFVCMLTPEPITIVPVIFSTSLLNFSVICYMSTTRTPWSLMARGLHRGAFRNKVKNMYIFNKKILNTSVCLSLFIPHVQCIYIPSLLKIVYVRYIRNRKSFMFLPVSRFWLNHQIWYLLLVTYYTWI